MVDFHSPCRLFTLTVEDDGRVAHGYLKQRDEIVGDVWLYNRCPTPEAPEWKDKSKIPFANCKGYVAEGCRVTVEVKADDINVTWQYGGGRPRASILVFGDLYAWVSVGDKPGHARFASRDGPLAKSMGTAGAT